MTSMTAAAAHPLLPSWLEEHCVRLNEPNSTISNLNLNIRRFNHEMMQALAKALSDNKRIQIINMTSALSSLSGNNNNSNTTTNNSNSNHPDAILLPLSHVLSYHASLEIVHLSYNQLEDASSLGVVLQTNTRLVELYLDYNRLNCKTAMALAHGLRHNRTLLVLQLNSNRIGDVGGQALGMALRDNATLTTLSLLRNHYPLGALTGQAFHHALYYNVTLTKLQLDETPFLAPYCARLQYITRANQVGRYLLRIHSTETKQQSSYLMGSLWPLIFERLESDMIYFYLQEKPDLVPSPAAY
jgi:hypothetical protein